MKQETYLLSGSMAQKKSPKEHIRQHLAKFQFKKREVMNGINKVILVGNLGRDPETRQMPSGGSVTNISIATSKTWKDKASGEKKEQTQWHRVMLFNKLSDISAQYLKKGSKVYIEGSLKTSEYEKNGQKQYSTDIVASEMQMLDSKGDQQNSNGFGSPPIETADDEVPF